MLVPIPNVTAVDPICFLGVDLGQRGSHTAFITLERFDQKPDFTDMLRGAELRTRYIVRQAERLPLGTPYDQAIQRLKAMVVKLLQRGTCVLVIDESGGGIPLVETIKKELWGTGARIVPLTITSGQTATATSVPRSALIIKMQVMAERGELEISPHCRDIEALKNELAHLHIQKSSTQSDDLALALCLACWRAKPR